jgi:hypothetical protein
VALSCSESLRRSHPTNLVVLLLFTACEAVMVGVISAMYDTQVCVCVLLGGVVVCVVVGWCWCFVGGDGAGFFVSLRAEGLRLVQRMYRMQTYALARARVPSHAADLCCATNQPTNRPTDRPQVVLVAAVMTVGITASLTLYALQTKRDFTASGGCVRACVRAWRAGCAAVGVWGLQRVNEADSCTAGHVRALLCTPPAPDG